MKNLVLVVVLGFALVACGNDDGAGEQTPQTPQTVAQTDTGASAGGDRRREAMANMTPEQREAFQKRRQEMMANMTDEQRAAFEARRKSMGQGGAGNRTASADNAAAGPPASAGAQTKDAKSPATASGGDRASKMRERMSQFRNRPVPVAVTEVQRGSVDAFYATTASLTAEEEASTVARTQGIVKEIYVEEGDAVEAGTALAQLDTDRLALEVARTRTNIESFERAFARAQQLNTTKMISPEAYDQALYNLEREKDTLALQLYELEEATIRAPIAGVVTLRHIKLGNSLSPNSPAFEIKQLDLIEAVLNVPEKELVKIAEGQMASVQIDALNDRTFEGMVKRVAPEIDPDSGTFRVTVRVMNEDSSLKPGMFARVNIRYDHHADTLLVAREAVVTQKDDSTVFVVRDGLATRQSVRLGYAMGSEVEILDGLGEGDQVVITGQGGLRDGASVRVVSL
jgi:membrane fusion protein, multidrug efflux system